MREGLEAGIRKWEAVGFMSECMAGLFSIDISLSIKCSHFMKRPDSGLATVVFISVYLRSEVVGEKADASDTFLSRLLDE